MYIPNAPSYIFEQKCAELCRRAFTPSIFHIWSSRASLALALLSCSHILLPSSPCWHLFVMLSIIHISSLVQWPRWFSAFQGVVIHLSMFTNSTFRVYKNHAYIAKVCNIKFVMFPCQHGCEVSWWSTFEECTLWAHCVEIAREMTLKAPLTTCIEKWHTHSALAFPSSWWWQWLRHLYSFTRVATKLPPALLLFK